MNISDFTPEQMIGFCFAPTEEIEERIKKTTEEFIQYSTRVHKGKEPFSEHQHNKFIRIIDILRIVKQEQAKYLQEFFNAYKS